MSKPKKPLFDTAVFIQYEKQMTPRETFYKKGDLLVPTMSDWWETAKMIRRLRFGEKSVSQGKTPKVTDAHRLQNDALIARGASLHHCFVVTTNTADFNLFTPFMEKLEVISANDFFA